MMKYMIGVDIGTTSTKAVLYNEEGNMIDQSLIEYPLLTPTVDISEEDPDKICHAVQSTIRNVVLAQNLEAKHIKFVTFSAQMHSLIVMNHNHQRLTHSITWADNRAQAVVEKLKHTDQSIAIYQKTGTPIHAMSPLSKMMWLKEEETELFQKAAQFVDIKSYILYQLTGRWVMDWSIASATGLMNLKTKKWDQDILRLLELEESQLPQLVPTTTRLEFKDQQVAESLGLSKNVPIVVGASDGVLSNLGVNRFRKGEVALTIGTSGAIRTVVDKPLIDPEGRTFCYVLDESHYVIGGPVNNGAVVLRWLRDELLADEVEVAKRLGIDSYHLISKIAERVEPGAKGLLFHPYLTGERAPLWTSDARGSFIGLTLAHRKEHMIRAVLEGVVFNLYSVFMALSEIIGDTPYKISATGGFSKSAVWRQMVSDVFNCHVDIPTHNESSCLGACIIGLKAMGEIENYDIVEKWITSTHVHSPNLAYHEVYQQLIPIFNDISLSLSETYRNLAQFQRKNNLK